LIQIFNKVEFLDVRNSAFTSFIISFARAPSYRRSIIALTK